MLEDTADLFENDDEKKQVMANIQNIFKTNNKEGKTKYVLYGMKPEVFERSASNPRRVMPGAENEESFSL